MNSVADRRSVPPSVALRAVGSFDLLVTAIFAVPGLSHLFIALIDEIGVMTGLAPELPPFSPFAMFMVNLAGVLGVCWNLVILRTRSWEMLRINIVARWLVAALIIGYVLIEDVTPIILLFVISEIGGSLVEHRQRPTVDA